MQIQLFPCEQHFQETEKVKYCFSVTQTAVSVGSSVSYCWAKGSRVGLWIPLIPQTKPSFKWEPDRSSGFSLALLTILNPPPSPLNTPFHPVLCQASLRPSNALDFYYQGWWDIHKETICQQDGKHVFCSFPVCFLERSLKNYRASGIPSLFTWHHLAGGNW